MNSSGNTPLHTLVEKQFSDKDKFNCVVALLAHGVCNPNKKTIDGKTALHLAVEVCICICINTEKMEGVS